MKALTEPCSSRSAFSSSRRLGVDVEVLGLTLLELLERPRSEDAEQRGVAVDDGAVGRGDVDCLVDLFDE